MFDRALPARLGSTLLRRFSAADLERFHDYRTDPELARYQGWSAMSRDEAAGFIAEMAAQPSLIAGDWVQLAIADAATDVLLGDVGVHLGADGVQAEIGFTLHADSQRRGHASRAVELGVALVLRVPTVAEVRAIVDVRNAASIRVLQRCGFAALHEQQAVFKGEACTERVFCRRRGAVRAVD